MIFIQDFFERMVNIHEFYFPIVLINDFKEKKWLEKYVAATYLAEKITISGYTQREGIKIEYAKDTIFLIKAY